MIIKKTTTETVKKEIDIPVEIGCCYRSKIVSYWLTKILSEDKHVYITDSGFTICYNSSLSESEIGEQIPEAEFNEALEKLISKISVNESALAEKDVFTAMRNA